MSKAMHQEIRCTDAAELVERLATSIADELRAAIIARGRAVIAVSGGSSPKRLFARLATIALSWQQVTVTQVDERWVAGDHEDSNARLIREHLLVGEAAAARFVPLKNDAATPQAGHAACEAQLQSLAPFDIVLLGMGEDGHTASLFPRAPGLVEALREDGALCAAMPTPQPPQVQCPRMSLTLAGLLASRRLLLPLSGAAKLGVLAQAQAAGAIEEMPIRAVLRQNRVPLELWLSA